MRDFVHLHLHTDFSLLDGCGRIKDYVKKAKEYGMTSMALTDHGTMFGAIDFYQICKENGIKPIIGCEFYIAENDISIKDETNKRRNHLILLAKDNEGYKNLIKMASIAYVDGFYFKPRVDKSILEKYNKGLVCLSACIAGEIPRLLLQGRDKEAEEAALWYKNLYGEGNYYIEIQNHFIKEELEVNPKLIALAKKLNIPLVATNDCHYVNKDDAEAQDALMCIGMGRRVSEEDRLSLRRSSEELYFKSGDEMQELFEGVEEALDNTLRIREQCNLELDLPGPLPPHFKIEEGTTWDKTYFDELGFGIKDPNKKEDFNKLGTVGEEWIDEAALLAHLANEGLKKRYNPVTKELKERLDYELNVIISMNFSGYYLIVSDYVNWSKNNGVSVGPGRGSGAGSIVAYSLRITDIDPIKYGLLFERFLNPERVSMPDFDIDFCTDNRERTIEYVTQKYGQKNVGQICTFGTLKVKNCIKDVCRVLDIPLNEANEMCEALGKDFDGAWDRVINGYENDLGAKIPPCARIKEYIARGGVYAKMADIIPRIEGMVRQIGLHAAGLLISQGELDTYLPLYRDPKKGTVASQYEMTQIEDCGLVKMDFLGLKTLTLIDHTVEFINRKKPGFRIEEIPENDKKTFELFSRGESHGVFQFESAGMRKILKQSKPESIEDLSALNALYRPGPMDNIPTYIENKQNPDSINYPFAELKELLLETYGVIVYQEQVMTAARIFAGYSMGAADNLRKIMGKKKKELIPKEKEKFVKASIKNGKTEKDAKALFELLEPFAGYGFNKSHAVGYAVLAYQTGYLKANYPVEFMAAVLLMEAQGSDTDKFKEYLNLVKEQKIKISPPDINKSFMSFSPSGKEIIYGLEGLKGMGRNSAESIIQERNQNGPFKSFMDFMVRMGENGAINSTAINALIHSGAFDSLYPNRAELAYNVERAAKEASREIKDKSTGQQNLFGDDEESDFNEFKFEPHEPYSQKQQLELEKSVIGCYLTGHPLDDFKAEISASVMFSLEDKEKFPAGVDISIVAIVEDVSTHISRQGKEFGKITISDYSSQSEVMAWSETWKNYYAKVHVGEILGFVVQKSTRPGDDSLILKRVCLANELPRKNKQYLNIELEENAFDEQHLELLSSTIGLSYGKYPIILHINDNGDIKKIKVGESFFIDGTSDTVNSIEECAGVKRVWWT